MSIDPEGILSGQGAADTAARLLTEALDDDHHATRKVDRAERPAAWVKTQLKRRVEDDYPIHERYPLDAVDLQGGDPNGDNTPLERYEAYYAQRAFGMIPDGLHPLTGIQDLTDLNQKVDDTLDEINKIGPLRDNIWCSIRGSRPGIGSSTCTNNAARINGDWRETGRGVREIIKTLDQPQLRFLTWFGKYRYICRFMFTTTPTDNEQGLILGALEWRKAVVALGSAHQEVGLGDVGEGVKSWEELLNKAESEFVEMPHKFREMLDEN